MAKNRRKRKKTPITKRPCNQPWHRHHGNCQMNPQTGRCEWCNIGNHKTGTHLNTATTETKQAAEALQDAAHLQGLTSAAQALEDAAFNLNKSTNFLADGGINK